MTVDLFDPLCLADTKARVARLTPDARPLWGKMDVAQMLAHCNVAYEIEYTDRHPRPNAFVRLVIKWFVKDKVCGPRPYARNARTAPMFKVTEPRDFEAERQRLVDYLNRTHALGPVYFDGRESASFGRLSELEWNRMFSKHLEHHLTQFGV